MLNNIYIPKVDDTKSSNICKRAKIDTGTTCNYKCHFCYYLDKLQEPFKNVDIIYKEIDNYQERGITSFDLSGGESSIHPEFFNIIKHCKQYGNVSMLSNGSMLYNFEFAQQSYNAGLTEVLFSVHGYDKKSHDRTVQHKKAFEHILQSITNCHILGIKVRINCTIDESFEPDEYLKLFNSLGAQQLNFLPINYWDKASDLKSINYEKLSTKIKIFIDRSKNKNINIRYIPFCFMEGYEKYIVDTYQHIFDEGDWNIQVYDNTDGQLLSKEQMFATAKYNRRQSYTKPMSCNTCKYVYICDGIEKNNLDTNILVPIIGDKIKDVMEERNKR